MGCVVDGLKNICDQFKILRNCGFRYGLVFKPSFSAFSCFSHSMDDHRILLAERRGYLVIRIKKLAV